MVRHWNDGWPQAQVVAIGGLVVLGIVLTSSRLNDRALRQKVESTEGREAQAQIELDRLRTAANALDLDALEADRKLFAQLVSALPSSDPALRFLRTHDFGATFVLDQLDGLSEFEHSGWDDPERMFHDGALDAARERFLAAVKCFLQLVSSNTGPVGATLRRQGVAEAHILDSVRVVDSDVNRQFVTEIDELNEAADLVGIRHSELLTLGRQRLRT